MTATLELVAPPAERPALTFARLLTNQPDLDEAARLIVALLCWPIGAEGCFIVEANGSGFDTLGSYVERVDPDAGVDGRLTSSIDRIAHAAAQAMPSIWTSPPDTVAPPMAAWPLGGQHAELVVLLADPLAPTIVEERVGDLVDILAVYVAGILAASDPRNRSRKVRQVTSAPTFSERQLQTLRLLERNFTMRQIASRIGFSESTVRMESLAIYRALGVHDRRGAVSMGRKLGLLGPGEEAHSFEHN